MTCICFFIIYLHLMLRSVAKKKPGKENHAVILIHYNVILPLILFHFLPIVAKHSLSSTSICESEFLPLCLFVALVFCFDILFVQMKTKMVFTCFFLMLLPSVLFGN